jgi:hypothetical protein
MFNQKRPFPQSLRPRKEALRGMVVSETVAGVDLPILMEDQGTTTLMGTS